MSLALAALFASGRAADLVLAVMAAEAALLVAFRRWPWREAAALVLPGALIVLALRAALAGAAWPWVALPLALSLPAHLADLGRRGALDIGGSHPHLGRRRRSPAWPSIRRPPRPSPR